MSRSPFHIAVSTSVQSYIRLSRNDDQGHRSDRQPQLEMQANIESMKRMPIGLKIRHRFEAQESGQHFVLGLRETQSEMHSNRLFSGFAQFMIAADEARSLPDLPRTPFRLGWKQLADKNYVTEPQATEAKTLSVKRWRFPVLNRVK